MEKYFQTTEQEHVKVGDQKFWLFFPFQIVDFLVDFNRLIGAIWNFYCHHRLFGIPKNLPIHLVQNVKIFQCLCHNSQSGRRRRSDNTGGGRGRRSGCGRNILVKSRRIQLQDLWQRRTTGGDRDAGRRREGGQEGDVLGELWQKILICSNDLFCCNRKYWSILIPEPQAHWSSTFF